MAEKVTIDAEVLKALQARLDALEHRDRIATEVLTNPAARFIDPAYETWKAEASRPANERTQAIADKKYQGPHKYRVRLDSTSEDGKAGPSIREHFPLVIAANDELHAQSRYLEVMGIKKHDYKVVAEVA